MGLPFDHIASTDDSRLTRTAIGQLQRKRVWKYIESIMPQLRGYEMLELHSGNEEDALMFGGNDFDVVATDLGCETLKISNGRNVGYSLQNQISSHYIDLEAFDETLFGKKFDLVFSNFGGLNRINPESLRKLFTRLPSILNPGGRFIGVVMPKFCVWETLFFALRLQFTKAFGRFNSKEILSEPNTPKSKMWFYNPSQIKSWSKERFKLVSVRPIGLALPPFSLNNLFSYRKKLLFYLNSLEKKIGEVPQLSSMSDHFVIDLKLNA